MLQDRSRGSEFCCFSSAPPVLRFLYVSKRSAGSLIGKLNPSVLQLQARLLPCRCGCWRHRVLQEERGESHAFSLEEGPAQSDVIDLSCLASFPAAATEFEQWRVGAPNKPSVDGVAPTHFCLHPGSTFSQAKIACCIYVKNEVQKARITLVNMLKMKRCIGSCAAACAAARHAWNSTACVARVSSALLRRMQSALRSLSRHATRCVPLSRGAVRCMATAEPTAGSKRKMGKTIGEWAGWGDRSGCRAGQLTATAGGRRQTALPLLDPWRINGPLAQIPPCDCTIPSKPCQPAGPSGCLRPLACSSPLPPRRHAQRVLPLRRGARLLPAAADGQVWGGRCGAQP